MSKRAPLTNAQIIAWFGENMFGVEWCAAMGRLTEVNPRTMQRIRAAASAGQEYPAARGVLPVLADRLAHYAAEARRFVPQPQR